MNFVLKIESYASYGPVSCDLFAPRLENIWIWCKDSISLKLIKGAGEKLKFKLPVRLQRKVDLNCGDLCIWRKQSSAESKIQEREKLMASRMSWNLLAEICVPGKYK